MENAQLVQQLLNYSPFDQLNGKLLEQLAKHIEVKRCPTGTALFQADDFDTDEFYLLKGEVKLAAKDGRENVVSADKSLARYPLARLRPRMFSGIAGTDLQYFTVGKPVVDLLQYKAVASQDAFSADDLVVDTLVAQENQALIKQILKGLEKGSFTMPSLPDVALKVSQCADDPDSSLADLAKLINTDPAMAVKLLKVANSPLYRGASACKDTMTAISRLGLATTRQLVTSFAVFSVFDNSVNASYVDDVQKLWRQGVKVAAYCYVLAKQLSGFEPQQALLSGLLHGIGELAIVSYASQFQGEEVDDLSSIRTQLRGHVGAAMLESWDFPAELITVVREMDNWLRDSEGELDYCNLVQVAVVYAVQNRDYEAKTPNIMAIPAFRKLNLSQEQADEFMQQAQKQIDEVRSWFTA